MQPPDEAKHDHKWTILFLKYLSCKSECDMGITVSLNHLFSLRKLVQVWREIGFKNNQVILLQRWETRGVREKILHMDWLWKISLLNFYVYTASQFKCGVVVINCYIHPYMVWDKPTCPYSTKHNTVHPVACSMYTRQKMQLARIHHHKLTY